MEITFNNDIDLNLFKNKNLLITGGCGFIGSSFCNFISKYVNKLVIIDKISEISNIKNIENIIDNTNIILIKENILNHNFFNTFKTYNINYIIHFAAQTHVDNSYKYFDVFLEDNIKATQYLLDCVLKYDKRIIFLHFSTDEIYGPSLNDKKFTEESNFNPTNPYAASKASCELIINTYKYSYGLPIIITRCNNVYGNFQNMEKVIPKFIYNAINDKSLELHGYNDKIRDFIHINDVIRAIIYIILKGNIGEIYNIGVDNPIKIKDLAIKIINKIGKGKIIYIDDRPFNDYRYNIDCSKLEKLGWKSIINFDESLDEIIKWFINNPNYWL